MLWAAVCAVGNPTRSDGTAAGGTAAGVLTAELVKKRTHVYVWSNRETASALIVFAFPLSVLVAHAL